MCGFDYKPLKWPPIIPEVGVGVNTLNNGSHMIISLLQSSHGCFPIIYGCFPLVQLTCAFTGIFTFPVLQDLPDSIDDFILPVTHNTVADVFVVGLQECSCDHKKWEVLIQQTLGPSHVLVQSVLFGALHLAVFIRRDLLWYCSCEL